MPMKIRLLYSDGRYWAAEYSEPPNSQRPFVEMSEEDWREYRDHLETDQRWQDFLLDLDNAQHEVKS